MCNTVTYDLARFNMWNRLIPGYAEMSKREKHRAKLAYASERGCFPSEIEVADPDVVINTVKWAIVQNAANYESDLVIFDNFEVTLDQEETSNEGQTTMNIDHTAQRRHLNDRAYAAKDKFHNQLMNHFHLNGDYPATLREALDRIAKGTVKFPTIEKFEEHGYDPDCSFFANTLVDYIDWRIEDADRVGYTAANKKLDQAYTELKDDIAILEPEKALASLRAFEARTFH